MLLTITSIELSADANNFIAKENYLYKFHRYVKLKQKEYFEKKARFTPKNPFDLLDNNPDCTFEPDLEGIPEREAQEIYLKKEDYFKLLKFLNSFHELDLIYLCDKSLGLELDFYQNKNKVDVKTEIFGLKHLDILAIHSNEDLKKRIKSFLSPMKHFQISVLRNKKYQKIYYLKDF